MFLQQEQLNCPNSLISTFTSISLYHGDHPTYIYKEKGVEENDWVCKVPKKSRALLACSVISQIQIKFKGTLSHSSISQWRSQSFYINTKDHMWSSHSQHPLTWSFQRKSSLAVDSTCWACRYSARTKTVMMTGVTIFSATRVATGGLQPRREQKFPITGTTQPHHAPHFPPEGKPASQKKAFFLFFFPLKACVGKGTNNICKKLETLAHGCQFLKEDLDIGNVIQLLRKGCHWYKGHSSENGHTC